ncbi:hypothetical protein [Peptostreptococcus sp. MV1]|uniref:hypothetical protein n=1 Tax=Peptostreptococcus sp. MV1 TaxID=1219626 RepID=UPI00069015EB|nr:hypothetical protein [Peptostreptococcus sp. MV1]
MTLTISMQTILFILAILGCMVLVALIILLKKLIKLIENVDNLLIQNTTNVGLTIAKLPTILENVDAISDNVKEVSEVAVDIGDDISTAKDKFKTGIVKSASLAVKAKDHFKKN